MKQARPSASKPKERPHSLQISESEALHYHQYSSHDPSLELPGKIEVISSKSCSTQRDLSLAYTPGVAAASMAIAKDPTQASKYTARSNLVAVVSNGTAVLGLGDIGPLASKPVMEGKAVLFKRFANINVFDIELDAKDPKDVIRACEMLEPTVGGINLEDIKSPECFQIERELRKRLKIPVFHDDQHGTAIIVTAALINALQLAKKKPSQIRCVFSGAGAAAIACADLIQRLGIQRKHIILCDKSGVVHAGRKDLDEFKAQYAHKTKLRSLPEAMKSADLFIGLSVGGLVTSQMLKGMAKNPIIFALANPTPEISYDDAKSARPDALIATGRSDFPNQINNVLGFPYIFRGALDVESSEINEEMKMAAAQALADLAREDVPDFVSKAYNVDSFSFGPDYLIPKPFDTRALFWVAPAVAKAAMQTKVARRKIEIEDYRERLMKSIDRSREILSVLMIKAKRELRSIVFPEGTEPKIIRAAHILEDEGICHPILLGPKEIIEKNAKELRVSLERMTLIDPRTDERRKLFGEKFFKLRQRKGLSALEARRLLERGTYFGLMMVEEGLADGLVSGLTKSYPETIRPALQILPMKEGYHTAAGLYIVAVKERVFFFADTTVNMEPSAEKLAEIALQAAERAEFFDIQPRIAMLSFSNFGSAPHPMNKRIVEAIRLIHEKRPDLIVDGEMQADTAVTQELLKRYPFSDLKTPANILIFPNLSSGNIAYKLLQRLANAEVIGPVLMGPKKPVHVLQQGSSVNEIVNMATIAAAEANDRTT
ncbi:MAG: NADP-dependent malic enzyme [Bradymonadales bacterium]|nr:MAG: NADP-dependent malic enzyme [Bradymonadales bacterium]